MIRLHNLHDAAIRSIRSIGKYKRYDKLLKRNDLIMSRLFNDTMSGKINGFYLADDSTDFRAYHRSTKETGAIQLSSGFWQNGKLIPLSDVQLHTPKEMIREGYREGKWEVIV